MLHSFVVRSASGSRLMRGDRYLANASPAAALPGWRSNQLIRAALPFRSSGASSLIAATNDQTLNFCSYRQTSSLTLQHNPAPSKGE